MSSNATAFAVLGLDPGADRAAVDRAYRGLMKRHHPDLGGDPDRASAINRAYAEITRPVARQPTLPPSDLASALYEQRIALRRSTAHDPAERRSRWPVWLVVAALLGGLAWVEREALADVAWTVRWRYFQPSGGERGAAIAEPVAIGTDTGNARISRAPVSDAAVRSALREARTALASGGLVEAIELSGQCYRRFAAAPSLADYDRCVAIDDSVLFIAGSAVADRGGFGAAALTARQLSAGRSLAGDFDRIEDRLDRIRMATLDALGTPPLWSSSSETGKSTGTAVSAAKR